MNLNLIPADQQPNAIVSILRQSGALTADLAVQNIADANGDSAAALVVAKLPALVVADIVRHFDYSKTGIVGALLTPSQLCATIERLPLVDDVQRPDCSASTVAEVICGVILQMESEHRGKYFRELAKSATALLGLASAFPKKPFVTFARERTFEVGDEAVTEATIQVGNWQELAFALRTNSPQTFTKVCEIVITAHRSGTSLEEEFRQASKQKFASELTTSHQSADPFA